MECEDFLMCFPLVKFPNIGKDSCFSCFSCFSWEKKKENLEKRKKLLDKNGPYLYNCCITHHLYFELSGSIYTPSMFYSYHVSTAAVQYLYQYEYGLRLRFWGGTIVHGDDVPGTVRNLPCSVRNCLKCKDRLKSILRSTKYE